MRVPKGCPLCHQDVLGTLETDFYCRNCNLMISKRYVDFRHLRIEIRQRIHFHFAKRESAENAPERVSQSAPTTRTTSSATTTQVKTSPAKSAPATKSERSVEQWIPLAEEQKKSKKSAAVREKKKRVSKKRVSASSDKKRKAEKKRRTTSAKRRAPSKGAKESSNSGLEKLL